MRAYKSLEAFDFFVCGHFQDCLTSIISEESEFCFIETEVFPSQRQGDKTVLYKVWVCIHKGQGWVLTAYCTCMAGGGRACSHVAALLFKIEAASRLNLRDPTAPTSVLCKWNSSRKNVQPAPGKLINFNRVKKTDLPQIATNANNPKICNYSTKNPTSGENP